MVGILWIIQQTLLRLWSPSQSIIDKSQLSYIKAKFHLLLKSPCPIVNKKCWMHQTLISISKQWRDKWKAERYWKMDQGSLWRSVYLDWIMKNEWDCIKWKGERLSVLEIMSHVVANRGNAQKVLRTRNQV